MKSPVTLITLFYLLLLVIIPSYAQTTIPPDREQLLRGETEGQTLVAEINNFPSPQKILSLKDSMRY
jgi:hypothetical protein